jgi:hypothetical protein
MRNLCKILVGTTERDRTFRNLKGRIILKWILKKYEC